MEACDNIVEVCARDQIQTLYSQKQPTKMTLIIKWTLSSSSVVDDDDKTENQKSVCAAAN